MKNSIQIYGLPRSGTNLLEWSLKEYFTDIYYENKYKKCDVIGLQHYNQNIAAKHSYPTFEFSDKIVVIYKDFEKWSQSYLKWSKKEIDKEVWISYLNKAKNLDSDKCIIITHNDIVKDYKKTLELISKKFNFKLKEIEIIRPEYSMNKGGAHSKPLKNKIYKDE